MNPNMGNNKMHQDIETETENEVDEIYKDVVEESLIDRLERCKSRDAGRKSIQAHCEEFGLSDQYGMSVICLKLFAALK